MNKKFSPGYGPGVEENKASAMSYGLESYGVGYKDLEANCQTIQKAPDPSCQTIQNEPGSLVKKKQGI